LIYRVHLPSGNANPTAGSFIGYITLCSGNSRFAEIYSRLMKQNIIPADWLSMDEIYFTALNTQNKEIKAYDIRTRVRPVRKLLYLFPLGPEQKQSSNIFSFSQGVRQFTYVQQNYTWDDVDY